MSYVLINGKRYYKDDRTGRTTLDNVSQAEADHRAQRNQRIVRTTRTYRPQTAAGNDRTTGNALILIMKQHLKRMQQCQPI